MTKTCLLCMAINRIKLLKEIKMIDTFYKIEIKEHQPHIDERSFPKYVRVNVIKQTNIADCLAHKSILYDVDVNGTMEEVKALNGNDIYNIYKHEFKRFIDMVEHDID